MGKSIGRGRDIAAAQAAASTLNLNWTPDIEVRDLFFGNLEGDARLDMSFALTYVNDNEWPAFWHDIQRGALDEKAYFAGLLKESYENPSSYVACHDVADQLRSLMGTGPVRSAGGGGREQRTAAVALAKAGVGSGSCIIQVKATTSSDDGHSFSLIVRPDGRVDVLEAWASTEAGMDLPGLLGQCKASLTPADTLAALDRLVSEDLATRTAGYTALSTAYHDAREYELKKPGEDQKRRMAEWDARETQLEEEAEERGLDYRYTPYPIEDRELETDGNIRLTVWVTALKPKSAIDQELASRLAKVEAIKQDIRRYAP